TFYVIRSGRVKVFTSDVRHPGKRIELKEMGEGDFFGEVSLITDRPRTATVVAVGEVEVMELGRADFEAICRQYPEVRKTAEDYLKVRVREALQAITRA
ncbi:MAG: cyclic nucleotide-binding domain-containing protein, partial [Zetaproteobacteria bacterium]